MGRIPPPLKSIRKFCLNCVGNSAREVELCTDLQCPLYPYRFGRDPRRKPRKLSEEQKASLARGRIQISPGTAPGENSTDGHG